MAARRRFAPVFQTRALDDPQMQHVLSAVRMMLANHEPFPAAALDRAWNIRLSNAPFNRVEAMLSGICGSASVGPGAT